MGIMDLTEIELVQGVLGLIITIIYVIVGLRVALIYKKQKQKEYLTMGIALAIMSGYTVHAISFITYVLFDFMFDLFTFLLITLTLALIAVICWINTFSTTIYPDQRKIILTCYLIACTLFEIFLIYFLIIDIDIVAIKLGKFDLQVNLYGIILVVFALLSHMIPIGIFSYKTIKLGKPELKLRAIFILIGGISFFLGLMIEMRTTSIPIIILSRIIIISGAIEYYIGWVLQKPIVKLLVKEKTI